MSKQLFKESFQFTFDQVEVLEEKTILQEKSGDKKFSCFAVLKRVPVSRFTKNKNGRIYPKALWELLRKDGVAEGTLCLADHPADDGSVKNIVGIWKNLQLDNNMVYGDLWLLEGGLGFGVLFFNVIKAGGKCGLSSVGYGELDYDQVTVIPESYELVRLGDWVIDPSQSVFATFENLGDTVMEATEQVEEKAELKEENIIPADTNIITEKTEEPLKEAPLPDSLKEQKEDIKMSETNKIQEAHFRNHVKTLIREATKNPNLVEGQQTLQDLYKTIPAECADLKESVEVKLEELAAKLEEQVKEAKTKIEENKVSSVEMKKRYDALKEAFDKLKAKNEELKEVNSELAEDRKKMESDLAQFIADRKLMESDLSKFSKITEEGGSKAKELAESVKKMEEQTAAFAKDRKLMENDISKLLESNKLMEADITKFEEDRKAMLADITQLTTDRKNMLEDIKQFLADRKLMEADIAALNEQLEAAKKLTENKEITGYDDKDGKDDVTFSHAGKDTAVARIEADLIGKEKSDVAMKLPEPKQSKPMKEENIMEKDMMELDKDKAKEGEEEKNELEEMGLITEKSNFYQAQIKAFFAEEVKKAPALADFEKEVLASKSLVEAVRKVDKYKETRVDSGKPIKLSEGFDRAKNTPSWLENSF